MTAGALPPFSGPSPAEMINAFELAALVYDEGVSVDHLMCFFADELRAAGRRIGGVVQLPPDDESQRVTPMRVIDLMTGDIIIIGQMLGAGSTNCKLDTAALARAATGLTRAIEEKVDLLFVAKFGKQEIAGSGFRAEFGAAVSSGIPILTSVQRPLVNDWLDFTGGVGTLLACRLRILREWWSETDTRRTRILERQARQSAIEATAESGGPDQRSSRPASGAKIIRLRDRVV